MAKSARQGPFATPNWLRRAPFLITSERTKRGAENANAACETAGVQLPYLQGVGFSNRETARRTGAQNLSGTLRGVRRQRADQRKVVCNSIQSWRGAIWLLLAAERLARSRFG
jgi:hypothetical protein